MGAVLVFKVNRGIYGRQELNVDICASAMFSA